MSLSLANVEALSFKMKRVDYATKINSNFELAATVWNNIREYKNETPMLFKVKHLPLLQNMIRDETLIVPNSYMTQHGLILVTNELEVSFIEGIAAELKVDKVRIQALVANCKAKHSILCVSSQAATTISRMGTGVHFEICRLWCCNSCHCGLIPLITFLLFLLPFVVYCGAKAGIWVYWVFTQGAGSGIPFIAGNEYGWLSPFLVIGYYCAAIGAPCLCLGICCSGFSIGACVVACYSCADDIDSLIKWFLGALIWLFGAVIIGVGLAVVVDPHFLLILLFVIAFNTSPWNWQVKSLNYQIPLLIVFDVIVVILTGLNAAAYFVAIFKYGSVSYGLAHAYYAEAVYIVIWAVFLNLAFILQTIIDVSLYIKNKESN